ncbi:MAG TPA: amidohydrolase family protein [Verrucomicrobiae bacterium]
MILRAQVVLPITGPPIRDGVVRVTGRRIRGVTRWRELPAAQKRRAVDLGDAILLPGLVNVHCHLDYTHMAGQIPPPKLFTDWLKVMVATKAGWSLEDYAASWEEGAQMLLRSGTTTVADVEAVPELLPRLWHTTALRVISFLEMITIGNRRSPPVVLRDTLAKARSLEGGRDRVALSPHAPYTALPELLRLSARVAQKHSMLLMTHVGESATEYAMFMEGAGEMYDWLARSGRDMSDCGGRSPVQHLSRSGMLRPNLIAAHVNYLAKGDAGLLGRGGVSVVHCPRSHFYFQHAAFPLRRLVRAGVNVCLGTDSLATVYRKRQEKVELDMFAEMRALSAREPGLSARSIVELATVNGARALHLEGSVGELTPGALADMIAIAPGTEVPDAYEAVLQHRGPVLASMISGRWAKAPAR